MPVSKAQIRANAKYQAKAYDSIFVRVPKGEKTIIDAHAASRSESLNGFVTRAISETMARDNKNPEE